MKTLILKIRFFLSAAALITIIAPANLSAANLHAIIAGDTLDSSIGTSVKIDIQQVTTFISNVATNTGMSLKLNTISGKSLTRSRIINVVKKLNPGSEDMVYFYYSGHGYRIKKMTSKWPAMYLKDKSGRSVGLTEYWVFKTLKAKNPRFLMVISDSCNNLISYLDTMRSFYVAKTIKTNYKKLFLKFRGEIIASGCLPTEYSYGNTQIGGLFTNALIKNINNSLSMENPDWATIMDKATRRIPVSAGRYQNPQYEIKINSKIDITETKPDTTLPPIDTKPDKIETVEETKPDKIENTTPVITSKEDVQKVNKKGLKVTVQNLKKKYGGYWKFTITVKNTTQKSISMGGKIYLYKNKSSKVGTGIVFTSIKPGETKSTIAYCDSGKAFTSWEFKIEDIYDNAELDFKDDELDKMQKELDEMDKELKEMENNFK